MMKILLTSPLQVLLTVVFTVCYEGAMQTSLTPNQSAIYYVIPSSNPQPPQCLPTVTCHTLDEYITDGTLNSSHSKFVFLNGTHQLTESLMVYDSESLTLQGSEEGNNSVQVVCESRWTIALSFTRVSFLTIQNISFVNCSYNNSFSGPKVTEYVISALHFEGGSTLTLSDLRIINGGFSIINTHGQVEITRVSVTSWLYKKVRRDKVTQSFGGSYLSYFECTSQLRLTIIESTFQFYNEHFLSPPVPQKSRHDSQGLGLEISCTDLQIFLTKSNFSGFQNMGDGGNLMFLLLKTQIVRTGDYMLTISECHFENGHAKNGGGAFVSVVMPDFHHNTSVQAAENKLIKLKILNILYTKFINNSAQGGGGLAFKLKHFSREPTIGYIQFYRCVFVHNYLKTKYSIGGIAVHVSNFHVKPATYHSNPSFNITILNCSVQESYIKGNGKCSPGNGVITLVKAFHFRVKDTVFTENSCTAIKAISSNLVLEGQVNITNNNGSSGGGLLLCDDSVIVLKPNTQVRITNNIAIHTGGGITVESQCLQTRPMCFFQLSEEITYNSSLLDTVEVWLTNNRAGYAGHNLFGGSVDNCYLVNPPRYYDNKQVTAMGVFKKIFQNMSSVNSSVTSIARKICFCNDNKQDCKNRISTRLVYPGEPFSVCVVPVGQLDGVVPASVRAWVSHGVKIIGSNEVIQNIGKSRCKNLTYTMNSNRPYEYIDLHIQHEGDISGYIKTKLYKTARINIYLKQCPIGFQLSRKCPLDCKCECSEVLPRRVSCDIKKMSITKPSFMWIGYIEDPYEKNYSNKYLIYRRCPFDYCHASISDNTVSVKPANVLVQDTQCQYDRTGILCGACGQNLSLILGSSDCWSCSNTFLLLILMFALAGILLIVLLTVCDLTISKGK